MVSFNKGLLQGELTVNPRPNFHWGSGNVSQVGLARGTLARRTGEMR